MVRTPTSLREIPAAQARLKVDSGRWQTTESRIRPHLGFGRPVRRKRRAWTNRAGRGGLTITGPPARPVGVGIRIGTCARPLSSATASWPRSSSASFGEGHGCNVRSRAMVRYRFRRRGATTASAPQAATITQPFPWEGSRKGGRSTSPPPRRMSTIYQSDRRRGPGTGRALRASKARARPPRIARPGEEKHHLGGEG